MRKRTLRSQEKVPGTRKRSIEIHSLFRIGTAGQFAGDLETRARLTSWLTDEWLCG